MAHPRASFPPILALEYRTVSLSVLARKYQSHPVTIRRWLVEQGVVIRAQGVRL